MNTKELIFNIYKDAVVISKRFKAEIIKRFAVSKVEAGDIFARIQNYQIKKYGRKLEYNSQIMTPEEMQYKNKVARSRKNMKKNKYWENTIAYKRTDSV